MNAILFPYSRNTLWRRMKAWLIACKLYISHLQWLARKHYERLGNEYLNIAKRGIVGFVEQANKVFDSGSYIPTGLDWNDYCKQTWGIGASQLSHLRGAVPFVKAILESGHNVQIIEGRIRKLRRHVPETSPLIADTYALGDRVAQEMGRKAATEAIYRRSFEVLEEAERTGGVVQIGDKRMFIRDESSAVEAVKALLSEVKQQGIDSNPNPKEKVAVTARREGDRWIIEADRELPDEIRFNVYV